MSPLPTSQKKWIALSAVVLFALSGGVYWMLHRQGSQSANEENSDTPSAPSSSQGASGPNTSSVAVNGASTTTSPSGGSGSRSTQGKTAQGSASSATTVGGAGGGNLTNGSAVAQAPSAQASGSPTSAPAKPEESCFNLTFKHKAIAAHADEETCSHHKNWLKLKHSDINPKSVCVRVNGTPVHYVGVKGHPDELIFGSVAGPKAKVTVRYCLGKATGCPQLKEDCTVPKDEFMEAIGGGGESGDPRLGQWDPAGKAETDVMARLDGAVKKELETNDELNGRAPIGDMFKDWIAENEISACGTKQASN